MARTGRLSDLVNRACKEGRPGTVAIANGQDSNTFEAVTEAVKAGMIKAVMTGNAEAIHTLAKSHHIDPGIFEILPAKGPQDAILMARDLVNRGEADILMKGLVPTDMFLKAILDEDDGLVVKGRTLSYACALEIPGAERLMFLTDTAVIPHPDLKQEIQMVEYAISMARMFGVPKPKVALIEATEKVTGSIPSTQDDAIICKMAQQGRFGECVVDGPLDVFLACDPEATRVKQVPNRINGMADVLVFPSLEAANVFYKGLVCFHGAELAGLLQGTTKPVVVMSRNESAKSKLYCLALAVLQANQKSPQG